MREDARYVSVPHFAGLVSLSERTCWKLIRGGLVPVIRVGRRTLIERREGYAALQRLAVKAPQGSRRKPRRRSRGRQAGAGE